MIQITLPDNSRRQFAGPVSVAEVAQSIGPGLAKMTVAGKVDGRLVDASDMIEQDAKLQIITPRDDEGLRSFATPRRTWSVTPSSSSTRRPGW